MKVYHTSPTEIKKINKYGTFGDCLFFSDSVYQMVVGGVLIYSIELNRDNVILASQLYNDDIVIEIAELFDCDLLLAESLLTASENERYLENCDDEKSWHLQALRGKCAKAMGYEACEDEDEQGTVYIVPMLNRESDLKIEA